MKTTRPFPALSFLAAALFTALPAAAQSVANFDLSPQAAPAESATETPTTPAEAPVPSTPDPIVSTPSRLVGTDQEAYIAAVSAGLAMRSRQTDPFGQFQDPDSKPAVRPQTSTLANRPPPEPPVPLSEIVRMIDVTTIMPGENRFLVGTRSIRQGNQIPLTFRGKNLVVEVMEVSSRQIVFRNVENDELGYRKLDLLPEGMTPGQRSITPPGMAPLDANLPIVLGSN